MDLLEIGLCHGLAEAALEMKSGSMVSACYVGK